MFMMKKILYGIAYCIVIGICYTWAFIEDEIWCPIWWHLYGKRKFTKNGKD